MNKSSSIWEAWIRGCSLLSIDSESCDAQLQYYVVFHWCFKLLSTISSREHFELVYMLIRKCSKYIKVFHLRVCYHGSITGEISRNNFIMLSHSIISTSCAFYLWTFNKLGDSFGLIFPRYETGDHISVSIFFWKLWWNCVDEAERLLG